MKLQFFAELDSILEQHKDAFDENFKGGFEGIKGKLLELGYDVLINNKKDAEFIPSTRLSEVVGQRDQFQSQVSELNSQLLAMKDAAKGNEALQAQLQGLMDQNQKLMDNLENTKVESELMLAASDAISPKDILAFVDRSSIKINPKTGEVVGAAAEVERIRKEKPYLFNDPQKKKGGSEPGTGGAGEKFTMNALIRGATGLK